MHEDDAYTCKLQMKLHNNLTKSVFDNNVLCEPVSVMNAKYNS